MDWSEIERKNEALNKFLEGMSYEEIKERNDKETAKAEQDFPDLRDALKSGNCSICGYQLSHFSEKSPVCIGC